MSLFLPCKKCKNNDCSTCKYNGQSHMYMGEEYLKYRIAILDRYIPYLWSILNKKIEMPAIFVFKANSCCKACQGSGKVGNEHCTVCRSSGKIPLTTEQQFKNIFKKFVKAKRDKEFLEKALKEKQYKEYQQLGIREARPNKKDWVCLKCVHNYDGTKGTDDDTCRGCVNHKQGNVQGERLFKPVSKVAEKWYATKGHKMNFDYQSR